MSAPADDSAPRRRRGVLVLLPLVVFLALAGLFFFQLSSGEDPSILPSALIGHKVPTSPLPPIGGLERDGATVPGLNPAEFAGAVTVMNVWASWCVPCRDEAPLLVQLAKDKRFRLVGFNYKDAAADARHFLDHYGNPYAAAGADESGRVGIDWGVYGVPETYIIGRDSRIAYKLVGPITEDNYDSVLMPQIEKALAAPAPSS